MECAQEVRDGHTNERHKNNKADWEEKMWLGEATNVLACTKQDACICSRMWLKPRIVIKSRLDLHLEMAKNKIKYTWCFWKHLQSHLWNTCIVMWGSLKQISFHLSFNFLIYPLAFLVSHWSSVHLHTYRFIDLSIFIYIYIYIYIYR